MQSALLLCAFVAVAVSAAAASSAGDDGRGPLACATTDFCPIYCGNVQPITPVPSDADTQVPLTQPRRTTPCAGFRPLPPPSLRLLFPSASACRGRHASWRAHARVREDVLPETAHRAAAVGLRVGPVRASAFHVSQRMSRSVPLFSVFSPVFASFDALHSSVSHTLDVVSAGVRTPLLFRQVKYSGNGTFYIYGGNCSTGQLLPRGLKMSERNGLNLRQAYGSFLPASYLADPSKVFLQSDNSDRVIASGNAVFRAIFKDDMSASYSSDSLPYVDWFVPDKSPMNPGDFCSVELEVSRAL